MSAATATAIGPVSDVSTGHQASKRKRSRTRSPDPRDLAPPAHRRRSASPSTNANLELPKVEDVDPVRKRERERQLAARLADLELGKGKEKDKPAFDAQAEFAKLVSSRSGGVYVPPARLRALQAEAAKDKASTEYQRLSWDALRKSITGIVNRVNIGNIKDVVPELFAENLIRGRGLFARSIMKAQAASLPFTPVFAALVAIMNTKLPQVGELVLTRLVSQFRRAFKRNDKIVCHSTTTFIGHLVNQAVAHEIIALQILVLLLERPTDDSIEIAVGFMREVGAYLAENSPKANASVFERFRAVLNEGTISHRVQYMIEVLMQVRKDKYKDNPIIPEGLDLVVEEEQITHQIGLDDELQVQEGLNIFKFDPNYLENEEKYKEIKNEILGEDSDDDDSEESSGDSEEDEPVEEKEGIEDQTGTNLVNLRRVIYLTIMNALNYEEAVHKLLKVQIDEGQEIELIKMIIECCSQERSYSKFYGLIGERFSKLNRVWYDCLEQAFREYYETIHRYETNRLRNIARFFGHLLASDSISWAVLDVIKMNEDDTTSSSRIFVKIMFGEIVESMGLKTVAERFKDPEVKQSCAGMFPMDNPKNTRFAINYFTSIGMGVVTEEMREHLKNAPRLIMEQRRALLEEESSSSDDSSDDDDDDSDSSDSENSDSEDSRSTSSSYDRRRKRSPSPRSRSRQRRSVSPPRDRKGTSGGNYRRDGEDSRTRGRDDDSETRSRSRSPPPRRREPGRRNSESRSRSPPPRRTDRDDSRRADSGANGRDRERYRQRSVSAERRASRRVSPSPPPKRRFSSRTPTPPPRRDRDMDVDRRNDRDDKERERGGYKPRNREHDRSSFKTTKDDGRQRRPRSKEALSRSPSRSPSPSRRRDRSPDDRNRGIGRGRSARSRTPSDYEDRDRSRTPPRRRDDSRSRSGWNKRRSVSRDRPDMGRDRRRR